tara:strand:- start:538 stop:864 length:327 start_codon:yes stop_codon:yes gene_type:complete
MYINREDKIIVSKRDKITLSILSSAIILLALLILFATFETKANTSYKPKSKTHANVHSTPAVVKQILKSFDNPEAAIFSYDANMSLFLILQKLEIEEQVFLGQKMKVI